MTIVFSNSSPKIGNAKQNFWSQIQAFLLLGKLAENDDTTDIKDSKILTLVQNSIFMVFGLTNI